MQNITTADNKFICPECDNEITISSDLNVGDFFECEFCGIEFEVMEKTADEFVVKIVEEEK